MKIETILQQACSESLKPEEIAELSVLLAEAILLDANQKRTLPERYQSWKMARMMKDATGKALTLAMADQVFRPASEARSAEQFRYLIESYGVPTYLPLHEQIAMSLGATMSRWMPDIVMPAVTTKMRAESSNVILPSEDKKLKPHLAKRKQQNTRMNINQLGEAILGEDEAKNRLQQVIHRLESPDCEYISVKISAIFSQINLVAYDQTLEEIKKRLRTLYRTALSHKFTNAAGKKSPKFVNLDMEEYRDLHLTCDAFKQVLMEEEFLEMRAGIVLQAYLPDSFKVQQDLTEWAKKRMEQGGKSIKIRIVKGANLAMEAVEASIHDWEQAPYTTKADVDANYKRMVTYGSKLENAAYVHLGIASHNLFEIAYALILRTMHKSEKYIEFEMLEGMANHQARSVQNLANDLLLYAPVVKKEDFHSAISYLVRRLDENTAEENFLHDLFEMNPGCPLWKKQKEMFLKACERQNIIADVPNRNQNRATEIHDYLTPSTFHNAADTDWSLRHNMRWILEKVEQIKVKTFEPIPLQIGGKETITEAQGEGKDPSKNSATFYKYSLATDKQVEEALQNAVNAQKEWEQLGLKKRSDLLRSVAQTVAESRGDSIATMVLDAGKAIAEGDAEVSEAIDFANYYAESLEQEGIQQHLTSKPLGTVVVTPPWNFPYAIPMGGILAALVAGNTVILKPAPETVLTAWEMIQQLWKAGIPKKVLQFVPCPDNEIGQGLVTDDRVNAVILTGAYETARMFQNWKPEMQLLAETSGKNALIITNAADPDLAVKDLVKSAFGHAGQKCSAASLAIIEGDLYDNPAFMRQLKDAAASLKVGSSWEETSIVTPIIREPDPQLKRALTTLDDGEEWLLEPTMQNDNNCSWSPGIKIGVKPKSWYRRTECFGPVLGLVRANNLKHAIQIQNDSDFGLTGGIHTLDQREIRQWRESVEVGNAYINRSITGAIVQRQPFGGWKKSCFGPGAKAGGPNYVTQFRTWTDDQQAEVDFEVNYNHWQKQEFSKEHDPTKLHGETNHFRYVPHKKILLRLETAEKINIQRVLHASSITKVPLAISLGNIPTGETAELLKEIEVTIESEEELIARFDALDNYSSLRAPAASPALKKAANAAALQCIDWQIVSNGRVELVHYYREQSISETVHRYGNIIPSPEECMDL